MSGPRPGDAPERRRAKAHGALVHNAADPEQVRKGRAHEATLVQQEADDLRAVANTIEGRRVLWRLLGYCGLYRETYAPNRPAHDALYAAGLRSVGLYVNAQLVRQAPDAYVLMHAEAREAEGLLDLVTARPTVSPDAEPTE